ncbi:unnamed protein product [Echinostoma caproni]|uniref:Reverse transcriptase domain-containing protein n=1 Tax=Echinostoma caproni TaxID=27848 RepID=A0A183A1X4_9TREM|nr:unnamed protein product [Echinostoma caproni]
MEGYQGVQVSTDCWTTDLEFADDVIVFGEDLTALQTALNRIKRFASEIGLDINPNKTKMFATPPDQAEHPLQLDGRTIEVLSDFKYLGSTILPNGQAKDDVKRCIYTARTAFLRLRTTPPIAMAGPCSPQTRYHVLAGAVDKGDKSNPSWILYSKMSTNLAFGWCPALTDGKQPGSTFTRIFQPTAKHG